MSEERIEVTQADRDRAAWALDMCPDSMTWEKLTAHYRTPDQIWQANRVAQAFARHRLAALKDRDVVLEEAAKVAEKMGDCANTSGRAGRGELALVEDIAGAIRALKERV